MVASPVNDSLAATPWKLVLVGLAAGVLGGGLGVGGGIILVPLLLAIGLDRHRSHATSLAAIVLIAIAGATTWALAGEIQVGLGVLVGIGGVVGSIVGASLMHRMHPKTLSIVFGLVLLVAAIRMISGANPLPGTGDLSNVVEMLIAIGIGLIAGFFAGVAGIGGGVVIVPSAIFFLGLSQHEAQGTSLVAIIFTAIAGTLVNLRNQRVRLKDGLVVGVGGVVGSIIGSRLALEIEGRTLSLFFGFLVLFVSLRTLYRATSPKEKTV
jgi:uncharacterized membrane protein YfcA